MAEEDVVIGVGADVEHQLAVGSEADGQLSRRRAGDLEEIGGVGHYLGACADTVGAVADAVEEGVMAAVELNAVVAAPARDSGVVVGGLDRVPAVAAKEVLAAVGRRGGERGPGMATDELGIAQGLAACLVAFDGALDAIDHEEAVARLAPGVVVDDQTTRLGAK